MLARVMTRHRWRVVFMLGLAVTLALALAPFEMKAKSGFQHGDKLAHLAIFAFLALIACRGWPGRWAMVFIGLAAFGAGIEGLQSLTPLRSASAMDFIADLVGVAVGFVTGFVSSRNPRTPSAR